jgi:hypothetical protein
MGFFGEMFGFNPDAKKKAAPATPEQAAIAKETAPATPEQAAISAAGTLDSAAGKTSGQRASFMREGALLALLLAAGPALAGEREPSGNQYPEGVAITAGGRSEILYQKLAYFERELFKARQAERNAETKVHSLEKSQHKRMMTDALPVDVDLMAAKMEERRAERQVGRLENKVERTQEKLDEVSEKWTQQRAQREQKKESRVLVEEGERPKHPVTLDVYGAANPEMEDKLDEWGIVCRGNTIGVPMDDGEHYQWITADEEFIGVGFFTGPTTMRIVFEKTDRTYNAVLITYDKKLHKGVYTGMIVSDREGDPVR